MIASQEAIQNLLKSGEYLIRGIREDNFILSEGGGVWATDSIELALTFGDKLELIRKPKTILETDMFSLAAIIGKDDFSELTAEEWSQIKRLLLDKGYEAVNVGQGHMYGANDYWILDDNLERIPIQDGGEGDVTTVSCHVRSVSLLYHFVYMRRKRSLIVKGSQIKKRY